MSRPRKLNDAQRAKIAEALIARSHTVGDLAGLYDVSRSTINRLTPPEARRGTFDVAEDLTGRTFGEWTVIERAPAPQFLVGQHAYYWCRCSCGTRERVRGASLRAGESKRCRPCADTHCRAAYGPFIRTITCRDCDTVFSADARSYLTFLKLYRKAGWSRRGSADGTVHFCPAHQPN